MTCADGGTIRAFSDLLAATVRRMAALYGRYGRLLSPVSAHAGSGGLCPDFSGHRVP